MTAIIPVSQIECQENSWKSYLKSAISQPEQLLQQLNLSSDNLGYDIDRQNPFATRVPQPFIDKMQSGNPQDPLLLQVLSQHQENTQPAGYTLDPLQEVSSETPGLLHKYHGRVLLILASACAINCRYCFRRHFPYQDQAATGEQLEHALNYITKDNSITEVILSGGDPLIVSDNLLNSLIVNLDAIKHVKRLRIHSRLPIVIPQRITDNLISSLSSTRLLTSIVLHINHANEIDEVLINALAKLKASGTQLLNQSVLLKGINDNLADLCQLSERLFEAGILPYYIHQLDKVQGAAHFDTPQNVAERLIEAMRKKLPGYLVPRLAREDAGEQSKTIIR
jgi:L-lysine 2,3-aminomutase